MTKNVGKVDRIIRIIAGIVIIIIGVITGSWLGAIGLIPIITGAIGWCPLYCPLGIKTCSNDECETK